MTHAPLRVRLEARLDTLPVLPAVIARLVELDRRSDRYPEELCRLVESEPNFAVRVLSAANSASSAPVEPIASVRGAIARLGGQAAADLLLALSIARVFVPQDDWDKSLWVHALQVAHAARELATCVRFPDVTPEEAYLCGLLHDVGRFVMFQEFPSNLRRVDEGNWDSPRQLVEMERAICGLAHTELGLQACRKWGVPSIVAQVARDHHGPLDRPAATTAERATDLVRFADFAMFPSAMPGRAGLDIDNDVTAGSILVRRQPRGINLPAHELVAIARRAATESKLVLRSIGLAR